MTNTLPHHYGVSAAGEALDSAIIAYARLFLLTDKRLPSAREMAAHINRTVDVAQKHIHALALAGVYPTECADEQVIGKPLSKSKAARLDRWHDDMQAKRQRDGRPEPR